MRIPMIELTDREEGGVLAGAINGMRARAQLLERTASEPAGAEIVFLDFRDTKVATASYLREAVFHFRDEVRQRRSHYYPVIANANNLVAEELRVVVMARSDVLMLCSLDENGHPYEHHLIGELDPKQKFTLDAVQKRGETDAAELMRDYGANEKTTVQTAWNNRLSALANLGLVIELSQGRAKRYRPLFAEG